MSQSMVMLTDPNVSGDQDTFWWLCQRCRSFGKIILRALLGAFKHIDYYVLIELILSSILD